jgi:hypothetical protein
MAHLNDGKVVVGVDLGRMPRSFFDPMPTLSVVYEDGEVEDLFSYYPDEISFSVSEVRGLTREQVFALRHRKDVRYLQS